MSQVTGFPGSGVRLGKTTLLSGSGDPNVSETPDVQRAALNYLFLRSDAPDGSSWLYRCSTAAVVREGGVLVTPAVWTAK